MKSRKLIIPLLILFALTFSGCKGAQTENATAPDAAEKTEAAEGTEITEASGEITIVYTNDIHSYIDNVVKDADGNVTGDGLRFSKVAAMVSDMKAEGQDVLLVDAGDEIQGSIYGALDEGVSIIDLMNATGYDLATPGNHDFDYGVLTLLKHAENANFPYLSCNFHPTNGEEIIFEKSKIVEVSGKKIAFVGITTPYTISTATPVYFQDENGEFIYTVDGIKDPKDLYASVQAEIDAVKDNADYIIALGHVGVGELSKADGLSSDDIIANVSGLDAFIDGHSHTSIEGNNVRDKEGNDVILTQTGAYLSAVGVMTISADGKIETKLVNEYDREDETVAEVEKAWLDKVDENMSEKVAVLENTLTVNNPENDNERWIRAMEMSIGDFAADSIYWYFNDKLGLPCDVAFTNAGGIRTSLEKGDLTYYDLKNVEPFSNMVCVISATGQQIIDALEMGVNVIGVWDNEWNTPAENGGFMQVAGLSYKVDASVESSLVTDENGMFKSVDGEYRVKDVKVYNRQTGAYEPIDPEKSYQLGGQNYLLRNGGNGLSMFENNELTVDYVGQDYIILAEYIKNFEKAGDYPLVNTKNSPLSALEGYLIDYEKPLGAGRIDIQNVNYEK